MANNVLLNVGVQGQQQVNTLNQSIQQAGQNTTRTVDQFQAMRQELRQMRAVMLSAAEGSREYSNALARASEIQRRMREQNDILRLSIKDVGETSKNIAGAMAGVASGFQVAQGTMALFGVENEAVMQTMVKLQAVMSITQGLVQFANGIEDIKDLITGLGATAAQTTQQAANLQQGLNNTTNAATNTANSLGGVNNGLGNMATNMAGTTSATSQLSTATNSLTTSTSQLSGSAAILNNIQTNNNIITGLNNSILLRNNELQLISADINAIHAQQLQGVLIPLSAESNALLGTTNGLIIQNTAERTANLTILQAEIQNLRTRNAADQQRITTIENQNAALTQQNALLQQNAAANNGASTATASFGKTMLTSLGAMVLYMVAIFAVIAAVSYLIEKLNEVPKDLEVKVKLNEDATKQLGTIYQKANLFALDYNKAVKEGNKDRIKQLTEVGKKEYNLNQDRLNAIATNINNWRTAFKEYLKIAEDTYYNEALAKMKADLFFKRQKAAIDKSIYGEAIKDEVTPIGRQNVKEMIDRGDIGVFFGTAQKYKDAVDMWKEANEELRALNTIPFRNVYSSTFKPVDNKTSTTTNNKATFGGTDIEVKSTQQIFADINKEVKNGLRQRGDITERETLLRNRFLAKTEKDRLRTQYALDKYDIEHSKQTVGEKTVDLLKLQEKYGEDTMKLTIDSINAEFDITQDMYENGELSYREYLKRKKLLLEKYGEDTKNINNEILVNDLNTVKSYSDAIGILADSFTQSTADEMEIQDNKTNKLKNDLELSQAYRQADSEQQQRMMYELELANYESKKRAFEANKAFQIAGVITQGISNEMSILAALFDPKTGGPTSPINIAVAAASTIANVATTISSVRKIASTTLDKPVPPGGGSGSSGVNIALNPAKDTLTSKEENLNMMNKSNLEKQNAPTVRVSDINKVQNTVKVREQNSVY